MNAKNHWVIALLGIAGLQLAACRHESAVSTEAAPAEVEHIGDTGLSRLTLTAKAAERIGIKTVPARQELVTHAGATAQRLVVPYASVLYDPNGDTWAYTSPEPLNFVRHRIVVDYIDGDLAILSEGPPVGTAVVTMGVAELHGAEFEFEEE